MMAAPASRPRLLVVAGPNGAGKTTITERGLAHAATVAAEVDRFYVYDNSVDDRDAQLVLRAADGRVAKAYGNAPAWAGPILERLAPHET